MFEIFLVEDHDLMRSSMQAYLGGEDDLEVVGAAESAEAAYDALNDLSEDDRLPDLVLIDVALPDASGIDLLQRLRNAHPDLHCLMLSGHAEESYVESSKSAGARGYVMKGEPDEYVRAVRAILDGDTYRSETVASMWDKA
jgi:DNA-binding NarL/FixJ family response regulator